MSLPKYIVAIVLFIVCTGDVFMGKAEVTLDELRAQGYEAMFNLDYERARFCFREMVRLFPDDPAGPQCMAASLWLEELNRSSRLRASLYSTDSVQKGTEGAPDRRVVGEFREWTRKARVLAEARLRRNPHDIEAIYFLGATAGLKAVFGASIEHKFLAASRDAADASDRHREVLKLDPNFHDAELSIGLYTYVVGALPLPLKTLASIGGVRGSKKRGLEMLERVAREGHWARDIARVLLIDLYKREKRWPEAIAVSRDLSERYPRNYLFRLQTADCLILSANAARKSNEPSSFEADKREAFSIFESLLDSPEKGEVPRAPQDVVHYRFGEDLLLAQQPERAAAEFLAASRVPGCQPELVALARLRAAQSMDLARKSTAGKK
jgi:tetratricopeptide (TPR) repeat protein